MRKYTELICTQEGDNVHILQNVGAATMRKQGKKQAEEEKKACSVADPDPFGPEFILSDPDPN